MENLELQSGVGNTLYLLKDGKILYICSMEEIRKEFKDAHIYEDLLMFVTEKYETESRRWK